MTTIKSPFTQMAKIAVERHWCWNIYCPFCGHIPFRYAFLDLAHGVYPDSDEWKMSSWPSSRDYYLRKWGRMKRADFPAEWTLMVEKNLAKLMAEIDVVELIENVAFPEFTYILGIGLYYTERVEKANAKISKSLCRQMLESMRLNSKGQEFLSERASGEKLLTWHDVAELEAIFRETVGIKNDPLSGCFLFTFNTTVPNFLNRSGRRRMLAEMLALYNKRTALKPDFYAYLFTASEVLLLARVQNSYTFGNGFISHSEHNMRISGEPPSTIAKLKESGMWKYAARPITGEDELADYRRKIESIPVEREYVEDARNWLWSSANPHPPVDISLSPLPAGMSMAHQVA